MRSYSELERVVAAAVISDTFREQLLMDPRRALETGYLGEPFTLTEEEMAFLTGLRVRNVQELAQHVSRWVESQVNHRNTQTSVPQWAWGLQLAY